MAFIQAPSYEPPKLNDTWGGLADIFSDIASNREYKRQIERQRIADAQSAAAHASAQRNRDQLHAQRAAQMTEYEAQLAREEAERNRIAALRLSPEQFAREATIANASYPIPTLQSNFNQYPGEQGRKPSPTMFGYKGPTEYDRNVARANMMRGVTSDEALTWKRLEDAASTIAKREQDATAAFRKGQLDEVEYNKIIVQLNRENQALNQARKEAQHEINKKRDSARWEKTRADDAERKRKLEIEQQNRMGTMTGVYGVEPDYPPLGGLNTDAGGFQRDPDRAVTGGELYRTRPGMESFERTRKLYETFGGEWTDDQKKQAGLADVASSKIGWPELDKRIKNAGYSRIQLGEELAKHMKNVAKSSDEFTADEHVVSSEAILEALLQLQNINPQKDWLSQYRQIKSDKTNFIRNVQGSQFGTGWMGDWGISDNNWQPLTSEEITLTMLLKESKKRQDPQYENDKKRFKDKFGWLPKWA